MSCVLLLSHILAYLTRSPAFQNPSAEARGEGRGRSHNRSRTGLLAFAAVAGPLIIVIWLGGCHRAMGNSFGRLTGRTEAPEASAPAAAIVAVPPAEHPKPAAQPPSQPVPTGGDGGPSSKRPCQVAMDLSDRAIALCAQDAILAVQNRVMRCVPSLPPRTFSLASIHAVSPRHATAPCVLGRLGMVDGATRQHSLAPPPGSTDLGSCSRRELLAHPRTRPRKASKARVLTQRSYPSALPVLATRSDPPPNTVLDSATQQRLYQMLRDPLTTLQYSTALRRHKSCAPCTLSDVLRVADLGHRVFLMVPMRWRGPFARVCRDWAEIGRACWAADDYELVQVQQSVKIATLDAGVTQLSAWVRSNQNKPVFFLLGLTQHGRLEQMRVCCKKHEPSARRADDDVKLEHTKTWSLEEAVGARRDGLVDAQFVVTKHHAYCVVAVRGQALLIKLGGPSNGTHEQAYTDRFPEHVTTMSMCPLDNNIIAFGVPVPRDAADAMLDPSLPSPAGGGASAYAAPASPAAGASSSASAANTPAAAAAAPREPLQTIKLVNFAMSTRIQTLVTSHRSSLLALQYAPDSEQLLSASADAVRVWCKEVCESRGPGAMEDTPQYAHDLPDGVVLRLCLVHPTWSSVLLATNEALEVRELRPAGTAAVPLMLHGHNDGGAGVGGRSGGAGGDLRGSANRGLALKWRRDNMQVTAAAFLAQGNMLVVSDRGDRLLLLNYHGLHAAKRLVLPWAAPSRPLASPAGSSCLARSSSPSSGLGGAADAVGASGGSSSSSASMPIDGPPPSPDSPLGVASGGGGVDGGGGSLRSGGGGVYLVTAITECPDVTRSDAHCTGVSHLAVANSHGDIVFLKV